MLMKLVNAEYAVLDLEEVKKAEDQNEAEEWSFWKQYTGEYAWVFPIERDLKKL